MLQQFRRAISEYFGDRLSTNLLGCIMLEKLQPADVCKAHHSNKRWKPSQNGRASWYLHHVPKGYEFRNGCEFRVLFRGHYRNVYGIMESFVC